MVTTVETASGLLTIHGPSLSADDASSEFFTAAADGVLMLKRCANCEGWATPVAEACPHCHEHALSWMASSGLGSLVTWAVVHSAPHPAFADDMPITSCIVELSEGPWLQLRLLVVPDGEALRAGAPIEIVFAHSEDGATYPVGITKAEVDS